MIRVVLCSTLLLAGVGAQAALENLSKIERPPLRRPLAGLPLELGDWVGESLPIDAKLFEESQATECISRVYTNPKFPGIPLSLWINYSLQGTNMRHSPKICLPSSGWTEVESESKVRAISSPSGKSSVVSQLAYAQAELVQKVGFWYYIFGESGIERWVRGLPITSRSSHGRTTRGSGMTVEVFWRSGADPDSKAFEDFAQALLGALEPIMPIDRAVYHVP
jgi:hypothetical protein